MAQGAMVQPMIEGKWPRQKVFHLWAWRSQFRPANVSIKCGCSVEIGGHKECNEVDDVVGWKIEGKNNGTVHENKRE